MRTVSNTATAYPVLLGIVDFDVKGMEMIDDKKIKLIVEWTFDKSDFTDEDTLQHDYGGSWQRIINELIKDNGLFEILTWSDYEPKLVGIEYTQQPQSKEHNNEN